MCVGGHLRELEGSQSSRGGATLTKTDRKSAGWATKKNKNTIILTRRRTAWSLKTIFKMHGETDGSAWTDIWQNGRWMRCFICAFLSRFITSLGHSVRKNYVRIFWCPVWGTLQPLLLQLLTFLNLGPLPSFLTFIPKKSPVVARLPDLIGTIPPFFPPL